MGDTPNRGYSYPELATQPPDAAGWIKTGLLDVDADVVTVVGLVNQVNARLAYGPLSQKPAALSPGHLYFAYEG